MTARPPSVCVLALILVSCASPATTQATPTAAPTASIAAPSGSRSPLEGARGVLAQARVTRAAAAGPYYVSLVASDVSAIGPADAAQEPGFELVVAGSETLTVDGVATTLRSGQAAAIAAGAARARRAAPPSTSYFMSLRPSAQRARSLPPGRTLLYDSADLPLTATPPGGYDDVLVLLVLAPGQVVPAHMHGGVEPTYVLEGTIELRVRGRPVLRLGPGQGDAVLPDTPLLVTNVGSTVARVLVMLATPDGKPAQTQTDPP